MSLALYASPINNDEYVNNNTNNNNIDKKRNIRKTIKRSPPHVQKIINTIYESVDEESNIADFTPPPYAEQTKIPQNNYSSELLANKNLGISENSDSELLDNDSSVNKEAFNTLPSTYSNDYYKQYVPYYNQMSQNNGNKDQLLEKLNYMIHLLEEQQDVKTGHVIEEIILYSFLGVFMIFIIDSFARAAKYTR
jgi:hypothetical protein